MGEITAYIAGVEVALLEAVEVNHEPDASKWEAISKRHSIHLGGVTPSSLLLSHPRMSILSIYTAFDSYIGALRKEYSYFFDKQWVQHDGDSPLDALNRNCPSKGRLASGSVKHYLEVIDYYRIIRNVVAHPREDNKSRAHDYYRKYNGSIEYVREDMATDLAPNQLDHLAFDDVKLFARLVLAAADVINGAFTPSDSVIAQKIPEKFQFKKLAHDEKRRRKSIVSFLRMEYGLKPTHAGNVADEFLAH
jgi:hypothetical protein